MRHSPRAAQLQFPAIRFLAMLVALSAPARGEQARPDSRWRMPLRAEEFTGVQGEVTPGPEDGPPQFRWTVKVSKGRPTAEVTFPTRSALGRDVLVFCEARATPAHPLRLELRRGNGRVADSEEIGPHEDHVGRQRTLALEYSKGLPATLRATVYFRSHEPPETEVEVRLTRLQFFRVQPGVPPDGWLIVGASIDSAAFADTDHFWRMARARHPEADPLMIHLAVGGWTIENALERTPAVLRRHPQIRTILVHIGGNNVTRHRPYPGASDRIRERLQALLNLLDDDGRTVYLSRLSYRAYRFKNPVPPERNGSLPYNQFIFDPLVRAVSPSLIDPATGLSRMDPYTYFREHPEELTPDGIHNTPVGRESWVRLWLDAVGPLVYGPAESGSGRK